ncbi:MAG: sensor histidine kinase, partial [Sulfurihydrogenibium sp.]
DLTPIDSNKYSEEFKKIIQTFNNLLNTVKELYQKQKDFIVVLSHEIKTPLTTIITDIDITLRKDREKEEYIKTLKNIHEISLYILSIFQILNKLYKTKELFYPDIKQVNVDKVVKEVLSIFSQKIKEKNLKVELDLDRNLTIQTDEVMFKEILQNIISNAVNFNKQNGTIKIKAYEENSTVKLTVSDTGVGIEQDKLEKIFDEFYKSENSEGLGLGLSIVKLYSNILGIKINIKSVVNQGTTVELTIA